MSSMVNPFSFFLREQMCNTKMRKNNSELKSSYIAIHAYIIADWYQIRSVLHFVKFWVVLSQATIKQIKLILHVWDWQDVYICTMGVYFFEKSLSFQVLFYALFSKFLNFLNVLAQNEDIWKKTKKNMQKLRRKYKNQR